MTDKKKAVIIISAVAAILLFLVGASWFFQNKYTVNAYNNALKLIDNNSFKEAKEQLEKTLEYDYKDTSDLIKLCEAHISYDEGCSGAYAVIDDLEFKYQTKERLEKINAFIEESKQAYKKFYDELLEKSKPKNPDNAAGAQPSYSQSGKSKTYSYKSRSFDDDEYNAKDYKFAEDFYDDHYEDFYDFEDAEDYFNTHKN